MKLIERKDIDTDRWNARIANDSIENIFSYAWYLDAVCENWAALVSNEEYETILPIPYSTKLGVKRFYQAPFTREFHIFGQTFDWPTALEELKKTFKHLGFRTQKNDLGLKMEERLHQELILNEEFASNYNTNAKRQLKKAQKLFSFKEMHDPTELVQLFEDTVAHKIDSIDSDDLKTLTKLMNSALQVGQGEILAAVDEKNEIVAVGFFLKDKTRITYLKGAATDLGKKEGAMYALFDFAFERYSSTYSIFDFGGSQIENVAVFFRKLGGIDRSYFDYTVDNTPFWFRTLKKIKG